MTDQKHKRGWRARDIILTLLLATLLGGIVAARLLYAPYRIPSASMVPTLLVGEYVLASNNQTQLRVGDVVFTTQVDPQSARRETRVRRVLALPGQRIAFRDGVPFVNGVRARQEETREVGPDGERIMRETLGGRSYRVAYHSEGMPDLRDMSEHVVPAGKVFLVGDARDNALDSRIEGAQPIASIRQSGGWIIFSPVSGRAGHRIE